MEVNLLHIGDGSVQAGGMSGHGYQFGGMKFADAYLGEDATNYGVIMAGEVCPARSYLAMMVCQFGTEGTSLDSGCTYIGSPAREATVIVSQAADAVSLK